jgi:nucleoside-diphosphate-sugar epimerase
MNVAITGATGFIGKYFIDKFSNKYSITVLTRDNNYKNSKANVKVTDYTKESLESILKECDCIIHLAAGRLYNSSNEELLKNILLDEKIFSIAYSLDIKNLLFCSSRGVYGDNKIPWNENQIPQPDNYYALAKRQSELLAEFYNRKGLNIKILRIAQVFGIGEFEKSMISTFINNLKNDKEIIVSVEGIKREYIYIKDLIDAFDVALSKKDIKGIYNLGSGEVSTIQEIANKLGTAFDKKELVKVDSDLKIINENSLMDSDLFYKTFNWKPAYTFEMASLDLVQDLQRAK